jgi:hypothetical protein
MIRFLEHMKIFKDINIFEEFENFYRFLDFFASNCVLFFLSWAVQWAYTYPANTEKFTPKNLHSKTNI